MGEIFFRFYIEMQNFCRQIRILLAAVLLAFAFSLGDGFDQSAQFGLRYGPNLSWGIMGNTPFVWGQWLPQLTADVHELLVGLGNDLLELARTYRTAQLWRKNGA